MQSSRQPVRAGGKRRHRSNNDERKQQQKPLLSPTDRRSATNVQHERLQPGGSSRNDIHGDELRWRAPDNDDGRPNHSVIVEGRRTVGGLPQIIPLVVSSPPAEFLEPPRATPESLSTEDCSSGLPQRRTAVPGADGGASAGRRSDGPRQAGGDGGGSSSDWVSSTHTGNELSVGSMTPHWTAVGDEIWTPPYDADDDLDNDEEDDVDDEELHPVWSDLVRVNVSGQRFDFRRSVLDRHPETLLGNPDKRREYWDERRSEYFFDRHRPSFEAIFAYYQYGGRLRRPHQVADDIFLAEVMFHEIEHDVITTYKRSEGYSEEELILPDHRKLQGVWKLFEYPETSRAAFAIALVSVTATLVAIVLLCVETLPQFIRSDCLPSDGVSPNWFGPFFVVETVCHAWFTLELIVRLVACPSLMGLVRDFKTWVDVTALVPYYATLFNMLSTGRCSAAEDFRSSTSLAFLRVIRLVRIFKLTKHSLGLQVLILTFKASVEGLSMFLVALTVSMLVYSSALYYAEVSVPGSQIESIPDAFWWAIITMTTVGYGDKVPVGWMGRIIGAACAISGILTLAIPVPIIAGHFNRFYSHKTGRARLQMSNN